MPLILVTAPTAEPISLAEAQNHTRVSDTADNLLLSANIAACRKFAEHKTGRQLVAARWKLVLDAFPGYSGVDEYGGPPPGRGYSMPSFAIPIEKSPLIQVVSITYLDMSGATQTMPSSDYTVDFSGPMPRITPVFGKIWPIPLQQIGAVQVIVDAGYAAVVSAVDTVADTVTLVGWKALIVGDVLRFSVSGDSTALPPVPLAINTDYYVQTVVSPGKYKLSLASGGAAIDITAAAVGTLFAGSVVGDEPPGAIPEGIKGWMLMRIGALYENREEVLVLQRGHVEELPYADRLLDAYAVVTY